MPFLIQYQLRFQNDENQIVTINLSDTTSGTGDTPAITPLTTNSAKILISDPNEDKFSVIKGRRIEFSFFSDVAKTLNTFISGPDNKWLVEAYVGATQIFSGWLIMDDCSEAFLPPKTYLVNLIASDNLGLLKDKTLVKFDGTNPRGNWRIIDFIVWALAPIGLQLPINVVMNLRPIELTLSTEHTFEQVYTGAKTWEKDFNISINPYDVLTEILASFGCFISVYNNEYWIVAIDELEGVALRVQQFSYDGVIGAVSTITLSKDIGKNEAIKFIEKDAEVMPQRPDEYDDVEYKFQFPKEIVDNGDFSRGLTWISPIAVDMRFFIKTYTNLSDFPAAGDFELTYKATATGIYYKWVGSGYAPITGAEIPTGLAYVVDDWTMGRYSANNMTPAATAVTPFVVKVSQYGDEKGRYVEIPYINESNPFSYLRSSPIPVGLGDKAVISVDFRKMTNTGTSTSISAFGVILNGDNGVNYAWSGAGLWIPATSFGTAFFGLSYFYSSGQDRSAWASVSADLNPFPAGGVLYILLPAGYTEDHVSINYSNLQFQYMPYINGSFQKYVGLHDKVSQAVSTKNKTEIEVSLSDQVRPLFKGGLKLKTAGGQFFGTTGWYNYNDGTTGRLGVARLGKYQAFQLWNQRNRIIRKFQGSLKGIDSVTPTDMPGLLHQFNIVAATEHSTNKKFMLLSYSMDLDTCKWSGIFAEVFDTAVGKLYSSDHEFKYTTGNDV